MSRTPVRPRDAVQYRVDMSEASAIEHRDLRSAIEFAVAMSEELGKRKAPVSVPRELRSMAGKPRIPTGSLGRLRRVIEADDRFREVLAAGAIAELVDPIGMLWLQRPEGWEARAAQLVAERSAREEDADLRAALRREEKRRLAAEQVAVRLRAELVERDTSIAALRTEVDVLRADVVKADDEVASVRTELVDARIEARHARDREAAAVAKLAAAMSAPAVPIDDPRVEGAPTDETTPGIDPSDIADVAQAVRDLAGRLDALLPADDLEAPVRRDERRPMRLPGGVIASSAAAAEFLLRSDAVVLVDGYNVAKLAWPSRSLEAQRHQLLDALENVARRFGTDVTVVFDGAAVVGAHAPRRRLIRVVYSSEGVIADDVIRDEVRRLPAGRGVVVVTNDAEIVTDVKALGANVVPSNALIAVL
jgi:predicted RNA-binding protein with PIN domain